jgi:hypothetical protein
MHMLADSTLARRNFLATTVVLTSTTAVCSSAEAALVAGMPPPAKAPRIGGLGDGADLFSGDAGPGDVLYPSSMAGLWQCQRVVTQVDGDAGQAAQAWRILGGSGGGDDDDDDKIFAERRTEIYATKFVAPPSELSATYEFDGELLVGVVLDRGFEFAARKRGAAAVAWNVRQPNALAYERRSSPAGATVGGSSSSSSGSGSGGGQRGQDGAGSAIQLTVVLRQADLSAAGFGFSELSRATTAAGGLFGAQPVERAVRVQRRWRRAFANDGDRVVEGLELVSTYRVLDGVAGALPTSTTKSQLRLTRPAL